MGGLDSMEAMMALPEEQSGYRVRTWGEPPVWESFVLPRPGRDEAVVAVEACGVGRTVINCINGDLSRDPALLPVVPGHELVGQVVDIGAEVPSRLEGRRVVAYFYLSCGSCAQCREGEDSRCSQLAGWVGVHRNGGYAPYAVLPAANLIPVPDGLGALEATVVPDAVATPVHVVRRAGIGPGDRVAVLGAGGGVGAHMVQVARSRGAEVAGLDITHDKLEELERLGVRAVDSSGLPANVSPFGADPPTVVVDLVGTPQATRWGMDALGPGGRMVALTTFRDRPVPFESRELVFREIALVGSRYATKAEVAEAARLVSEGEVVPVIGEVAGPDAVLDLHARILTDELVGRGALDWRGND
ncbi:MAG: alcohol dehydrogenase catalytic domain-containing protein [Actinomycetota bacterium]